MKYRITLTFILFFFIIYFFYTKHRYNPEKIEENTKKYHIVCTTMLLADLVKNLTSRENFLVYALMGPGVDPHTYKARPSDIQWLLDADIIIYNGLHLEGKMGELLEELGKKKLIICATDIIPKDKLINSGYEDVFDPHVWHDITLWHIVAKKMYQKLNELFSEFQQQLQELYTSYEKTLTQTADEINKLIEKIPQERRILITAHDAFRYFGIRYNFTVLGLQGLSTESDIGIRDLHDLADLIVTKKVKAIFPESCISPRNIIALQETVLKKGGTVSVGKELFSDSLSTKDGDASTYTKMLLHNTKTIIDSLEE